MIEENTLGRLATDARRQISAARNIRPSRGLLMYQMTQRKSEQNPPAKKVMWLAREDESLEAFESSLRWYLGDENWQLVERVDEMPAGIAPDERLLVSNPRLGEVVRLSESATRLRIVGPNFYRHVEAWTGCTMLWQDVLGPDDRSRIRALGANRYDAMLADLAAAESSLVFTTGPSIDKIDVAALASQHDVRVGCNSIVSNPEMMKALSPNVFAFGDGAFHFGPSAYAAAFRSDLQKLIL